VEDIASLNTLIDESNKLKGLLMERDSLMAQRDLEMKTIKDKLNHVKKFHGKKFTVTIVSPEKNNEANLVKKVKN